jgi:predicted signal transduction protein with EAL and GGDEF domain
MAASPEVVAQRILDVLRQPFHLGAVPTPYIVAASIGIARGQRPTAEELLRDADVALYQAKASGKDCYAVFAGSTHDRSGSPQVPQNVRYGPKLDGAGAA